MMKTRCRKIVNFLFMIYAVNGYAFYSLGWISFSWYLWVCAGAAAFLMMTLLPVSRGYPLRIRALERGAALIELFIAVLIFEIVFSLAFFGAAHIGWRPALIHCAIVLGAENVLFWSGMITLYLSSVQLGIRLRVIGILCGWIPVVHFIVLNRILRTVKNEIVFEKNKIRQNAQRRNEQICKTKYPLLLVHGVFFRDTALIDYWGRIPAHLKKNGAEIYYGAQSSAASVAESGRELAERIKTLVREKGIEKVNIIAHSKGGLDARWAAAMTDAAPYIASVTTINTPHRGCIFADVLLSKISDGIQKRVAGGYNRAAAKLGDQSPDFLAAVNDLTASACSVFNEKVPDRAGIYYQRVGSKMNRAASGRFPLNLTYPYVKHYDGPNDGLVALSSMAWGSAFRVAAVPRGRGISHADMIDGNRENIAGFDVREFYADLVAGLKKRNL